MSSGSRIASLRAKTLAIVIVATLALVLGLCLPLRAVVLARFEEIERELGQRDLDRARNALGEQITALGAMARDYAVWDETHAFAGGEPGSYVETNFADTTFAENRIGLIAVVDVAGRELWSQGFDLHASQRRAAPPHAELFAANGGALLAHRRQGEP
nr:hypothetical protein [Myxococcota bacterium]